MSNLRYIHAVMTGTVGRGRVVSVHNTKTEAKTALYEHIAELGGRWRHVGDMLTNGNRDVWVRSYRPNEGL